MLSTQNQSACCRLTLRTAAFVAKSANMRTLCDGGSVACKVISEEFRITKKAYKIYCGWLWARMQATALPSGSRDTGPVRVRKKSHASSHYILMKCSVPEGTHWNLHTHTKNFK